MNERHPAMLSLEEQDLAYYGIEGQTSWERRQRLADAAVRKVVDFLEGKLRECKHFSPLDDVPMFKLHAILDSDWHAIRAAVGLDGGEE